MCRKSRFSLSVLALLLSGFLPCFSQETTEAEIRAWARGKTQTELTDELIWHVLSKEKLNRLLEAQITDSKNQAEMRIASNNEVRTEIQNAGESWKKAAHGFEEAITLQAKELQSLKIETIIDKVLMAALAGLSIYLAVK